MMTLQRGPRPGYPKRSGHDVSDVADYLVAIEDPAELSDFAAGILPSPNEAEIFVQELLQRRRAPPAPSVQERAQRVEQGNANAGPAIGSIEAYQRMLNISGVTKKERETQAALERFQRNLVGGGAGAGKPPAHSQLPSLGEMDGMVAYRKGGDDDEDDFATTKTGGKRKGKSASKNAEAAAAERAGAAVRKKDEEADGTPVFVKPKASRRERAEKLKAGAEHAFRAPGRHPTRWVGNGAQFSLVGNCMDCGKILSDQEGEGPCLVCGSEHVRAPIPLRTLLACMPYLLPHLRKAPLLRSCRASAPRPLRAADERIRLRQVYVSARNEMLDGTPVDAALMSKRRRGGGRAGETDQARPVPYRSALRRGGARPCAVSHAGRRAGGPADGGAGRGGGRGVPLGAGPARPADRL